MRSAAAARRSGPTGSATTPVTRAPSRRRSTTRIPSRTETPTSRARSTSASVERPGGARRGRAADRRGARRRAGSRRRAGCRRARGCACPGAGGPRAPPPWRGRPGDPGSGSPPARGTRRRSCRGGTARGRGGRPTAPARARRIAVAAPAGPAPTTTASARTGGPLGPRASRRRPGGTRALAASGCPGARRAPPGASAPPGVYARRTESGPSWRVMRLATPRACHEPHRGPGEPPPAEVADDEAQSHERGEPAEQGDDGLLGEVMEDERAERHVDRAGPDRRLEARRPRRRAPRACPSRRRAA